MNFNLSNRPQLLFYFFVVAYFLLLGLHLNFVIALVDVLLNY